MILQGPRKYTVLIAVIGEGALPLSLRTRTTRPMPAINLAIMNPDERQALSLAARRVSGSIGNRFST